MSGSAPLLPAKRLRALEDALTAMEETRVIGVHVRERDGAGRLIRAGGVWSSCLRRFVGPLPVDWKPSREFTVGTKQYEMVKDFLRALHNDDRIDAGMPAIQDILVHGGRRSGKSRVLAPCLALAVVLYPGTAHLIVGKRKSHGERIIAWVRGVLDPEWWTYEARELTLRFITSAYIYSRNAENYDAEVGNSLKSLTIDEAALMPEVVYEKLSPSLLDSNGVCVMSSTPRKHNWYYRKYRQAQSEPGGAILSHWFRFADNEFLSDAAKTQAIEAAKTRSHDAYLEEIEGEFIPEAGRAFGDFSDENIRPLSQMADDATEALCAAMWSHPFKWIASVDFNYNPTIGTVKKFDSLGRVWIAAEVATSGGSTDAWGRALHDTLRALGAENPQDECIIIADATGSFQGVGKNAGNEMAAWAFLRTQGWYIDTPTGKRRRNPYRQDRLDIIRALICNVAQERRLFVDPNCQQVIEMFGNLDLKNGVPNKLNKHIHTYDGTAYGIYRVWGTGDGETYYGRKLIDAIRTEAA